MRLAKPQPPQELKPVNDWVKPFESFWTQQADRIKQRAEEKASQAAAAAYAEDFGTRAAEQLEAYARRQAGLDAGHSICCRHPRNKKRAGPAFMTG